MSECIAGVSSSANSHQVNIGLQLHAERIAMDTVHTMCLYYRNSFKSAFVVSVSFDS